MYWSLTHLISQSQTDQLPCSGLLPVKQLTPSAEWMSINPPQMNHISAKYLTNFTPETNTLQAHF